MAALDAACASAAALGITITVASGDNGSTDGTLDRIFPKHVTVVRNPADLGTSGSVAVGLNHSLMEGFDWTWVLDADSVPEPDAVMYVSVV